MDEYTATMNFENQLRKEINYTPVTTYTIPAQSEISSILGKAGLNTVASKIQQTPLPKQINIAGGTKQYIDTTNYSTQGYNVKAFGITPQGQIRTSEDWEADREAALKKLKMAEDERKISAVSSIGQSLIGMANAHQYYKDVKDTKSQYEAQKKIIDTNVMKAEASLMDNLTENMARVDAMAASQNVDLSSGGIQGIKQQGGIDLGSDIRDMNEQAKLNKLALDLDYAMKVKKASQQESDALLSGAFNIGMGIAQYSMGV